MKNNLLILGAGQYGQLAFEIASDMSCFSKIDFLDDKSELAIGKLSDIERMNEFYTYAFVALGDPILRSSLLKRLTDVGYKIATIISKHAYVSSSAEIAVGSMIEPMAVVQSGAQIFEGSIVSSGAVIRHNAIVGKYCHCDCNSVVFSAETLPDISYIAPNTVYKTTSKN